MQELLQARINSYVELLTTKYRAANGDWAKEIKFVAETPKGAQKYIRIVQEEGHTRSVHCFVALETGGVHKAAGWKTPARGRDGKIGAAKFNFLDDVSFEALMFNADPYGSYLYADYKIQYPVKVSA